MFQKKKMFFLFLLLFHIRSEYFVLDKTNFTDILSNTERKPIFVLFWASWCEHCKHFLPIWNSFKNIEHSFDLAEIECEHNREICSNYSSNGFPNLIWFDSSLKSNGEFIYSKFNGGQSVEALIEFCEKQKHFPLQIINEDEKINITNNYKHSRTTNFFFTINSNNKESNKIIEIAKNVANLYRDEMVEFYLIDNKDYNEDDSYFKLEALNKDYTLSKYQNKDLNDEENIKDFIFLHLYPFMQLLSPYIAQSFNINKKPLLALIGSTCVYEGTHQQLILNTLKELSEAIPVFYANCSLLPFFCRYTFSYEINQTGRMSNLLVLWDKHKNLFWNKKDILSLNETKKWLEDSLTGKIKGKGPGTGIFSKILGIYWDAYGEGLGNFVMMLSLPILLPITIYLMIISNREKPIKEIQKEKEE